MSGHDDDLFGMLTSLQIGNYVVADRVWKLLRGERQMHADLALGGEVGDEVAIFRSDGTGGNPSGKAEAGVRQTIIRATHRANQGGDGSKFGGRPRPHAAVTDSFAISDKRESGRGFVLVVDLIEEHDFSDHLVAAQRFQLVEVVDDDDISGKSFCGRGRASAERGEHDLLRGAG